MRTVHWLFVVSVALFISGIGFLIAGARNAQGDDETAEPPLMTPVANVKQIMNGIVTPAAMVVYGAVATVVTTSGIEEKAPRTDEEWQAVGNGAAALAESGNLLLMGSRAVDTGDWTVMSRALIESSMVALKATEAKDVDALLASGEAINMSCDNCHQKYQRQ